MPLPGPLPRIRTVAQMELALKTPQGKQIPDISSWEFSSVSPVPSCLSSLLLGLLLGHYSGLWAG